MHEPSDRRAATPRACARAYEPLLSMIEVRASSIHGRGVFAAQAIAEDTLIGEYEGTRTHENGTYVLWVEYDDGELVGIDGTGTLRFLNHSPTPNAAFWGHQLFSLRAIAQGEELTFDYGEDWAEAR